MIINYIRTPLLRYTFESKAIRRWVERECEGMVLNLFAGKVKLNVNEIRNDIDPTMPAEFHMDALEFVKLWDGDQFDTVILDPPYSIRKSMEKYNGRITSPFLKLKDELVRIVRRGGKIITFGYSTNVMGRRRGFILEKVCILSHGGAIHDTLISVERKMRIV